MGSVFRLPLLPAVLFYAAGIWFGQFELPLKGPLALFLLLGLLGLWLLFLLLRWQRKGSWLGLLFFFGLGMASMQSYVYPDLPHHHISRFTRADRVLVEGTIVRPPERRPEGTRLRIEARTVRSENHLASVEGRLLLDLKDPDPAVGYGDRIRFLCRLERPTGFRNPGVFSYERYLAHERIYAIGYLSDERLWVKTGDGFGNPLLSKIEAWRDHIRAFIEKETQPPASSILQALVLGEQGRIPEEVRESFVATGTAHLLAISGDHLGIVALLTFSLFFGLMKRSEFLLLSLSVKKWAAGLTLPCLLLYVFIAGGGISVIRAAIMVFALFLSIVTDRQRHLLHSLGLAAFVILLFSPPSLFDVSFQLSFSAVLAILYLVPRLYQNVLRIPLLPSGVSHKRKIFQYGMLSLLVTVVAIVGTAPIVVLHFNRISLIGWMANPLIVPWVGFLIVPLALIACLLSFVFSPLASLLIALAQSLTDLLLRVLGALASIPLASLYLPTPTALEVLLFYLLVFLGVHLRRGRGLRWLFASAILLLIANGLYWGFKDVLRKDLQITFLDVGHGDSILIEFPRGKRMLIDGGGSFEGRFDIGKRVLAPFLWKKKIRKMDYLVLTHPDPDHWKGLLFIASQFTIGQFWDNGLTQRMEASAPLWKTLRQRQIPHRSHNEQSDPLWVNGVEIAFLNPPAFTPPTDRKRFSTWLNNQSLVLRITFKEVLFLLPGDVEAEAEERMVRKGHGLRAQVLKVPHHGSHSSSSLPFLERVKPDYAIMSVGKGTAGRLPHPSVLQRYEALGAKILRTDRHGAIVVRTDGRRLEIRTSVREGP
ncbi:MAG: DNA internalization-related competence protein ComEC/Rec2 [Desulfobacterota bacterium]|nr:DNA internalization-related competence protein ComEC/Rec2 [Thermodesulfobacteriota bacterium]